MADYYKILEIERYSSDKQIIKSAYKRLAIKFHPDKNPDNKLSEEKFKEINEAYHTLIDDEKKRLYDLYLTLLTQPVSPQNIIPPKTTYNQFRKKDYQYYQFRQQNRARYEKEEARTKALALKIFLFTFLGISVFIGLGFIWKYFSDKKEAQSLYEEGIISLRENQPTYAYSLFRRSLKLNSESPEVYFAMAEIELITHKDYSSAFENLQNAIHFSAGFNPAYYFKRAYCQYLQHNYKPAIADFTKVINDKTFQDEAYFFRASSYQQLNNQKQACYDWLKASELGIKNSMDSLRVYCK